MSKTSKSTQTNEPPAWAKPLLKQGANAAMDLYNQGSGYHTYTGPTMADLSAPSLAGMNNMMQATGYNGAPITNQSVQANPAFAKAQTIINQMMAQQAAAKLAAAQNKPAQMQQQKKPAPPQPYMIYSSGR